MGHSRNIAVQLTAAGAAAIAVIRLKGPAVREFLACHFSRPIVCGRCIHGEIKDADRILDDAVVVLCDEITADVNVHGGPWVVQSVLDLARRDGFEIIETGTPPLSPDAFDAETELQREVLCSLPLARTELGVRVLLAQERAWAELKQRSLLKEEPIVEEMDRILGDATLTHLLYPPRVAIVGAANVGKSTLANQLFAQERSITADIPGTTRDWVGEIANIDGLPVMLVDTPGQRATQDDIERTAIERSRHQIEQSQLIILVLDATRPMEGEQAQLLARYPGSLRVVNKSDCPMAPGTDALKAIRTIATTGERVNELRGRMVQFFCGESRITVDRALCWTVRQRNVIERAIADPSVINEI